MGFEIEELTVKITCDKCGKHKIYSGGYKSIEEAHRHLFSNKFGWGEYVDGRGIIRVDCFVCRSGKRKKKKRIMKVDKEIIKSGEIKPKDRMKIIINDGIIKINEILLGGFNNLYLIMEFRDNKNPRLWYLTKSVQQATKAFKRYRNVVELEKQIVQEVSVDIIKMIGFEPKFAYLLLIE